MKKTAEFILFLLIIFWGNYAHPAIVKIAWNVVADSRVAGYKVYYGTSPGSYQWSVDVGNITTYTLPNLTDGITYHVVVTAYYNNLYESRFSNMVSWTSGCSYSITPIIQYFTHDTGTGLVNIITQNLCIWNATTSASWLTITAGSSGSGSGTVNYSISSNN